MEWIGGDQSIGQVDLGIGQQRTRLGDFAILLLAAGHRHSDGTSVLVSAKRDDHAAASIAYALAIQGKTARQQTGMGLQKGRQCLGISHRINGPNQVVERIVTGHRKPPVLLIPHA